MCRACSAFGPLLSETPSDAGRWSVDPAVVVSSALRPQGFLRPHVYRGHGACQLYLELPLCACLVPIGPMPGRVVCVVRLEQCSSPLPVPVRQGVRNCFIAFRSTGSFRTCVVSVVAESSGIIANIWTVPGEGPCFRFRFCASRKRCAPELLHRASLGPSPPWSAVVLRCFMS